MRGTRSGSLLAVGVVLAALGCGGSSGPSKEDKARTVAQQQAAERQAKAEAETARKHALAVKTFRDCRANLGGLVKVEGGLNARLQIGLSYDDYTTKVGDVSVAYERVGFTSLSLECIQVGVPAEAAFNSYAKAANVWKGCFDDPNCSNDSIRPELQRFWSKAGRQVETAQRRYERLRSAAS